MYTLLTTFPGGGSANVGDKLIEQSVKALVQREHGAVDFVTIFREESLDDRLDEVNASRAVLLPAFAIRDRPVYPNVYELTENLDDIAVPLVPIGSNFNAYPGDRVTREGLQFSIETREFLETVASGVDQFSCREYHTARVLERHGITNTTMTGDPSWFDLDRLGNPMTRPDEVTDIVFTPPLSPQYEQQGLAIIEMLADTFPTANKYCSMHLADKETMDDDGAPENSAALSDPVTRKNQRIREHATDHGFEIRETSRSLDRLSFYDDCSLHVGYECHAHLYFLRSRLPSVLVTEDARGVGFAYTFGGGGFDGFTRAQTAPTADTGKSVTSGYCTTQQEFSLAPTSTAVVDELERFLIEEVESRFRRYLGFGARIDDTYKSAMRPFVRSLP